MPPRQRKPLRTVQDELRVRVIAAEECVTYDYARRLSQAWTATDQCAATPGSGSSATVGGPSPYWQSWTYDAAGDRLTETSHDTTGNTGNDTTTTYTYPAGGSATDQPHTLSATNATGPAAAANTASYTYDPAGNTTSITGGSTGNQTLAWTDQDQLASDTTASGSSSYVYDANGNLVIRRDPGQTTMFFGDEQIMLNTTTNTLTATRYYSIGGTTIAARSSIAGGGYIDPVYLIPDRQGTDQLTVDSATYAVTRRQYLPFGAARGTPPTTWPGGDRGYVGGTPDASTSLENLGAREYDPTSGRFLSADPVFEGGDPTQMGGYDYAGNDPVTASDPTGLCPADKCGGGVPAGGSGGGYTNGPIDPGRTWLGNTNGTNSPAAPVIHTYPSGMTTARHGGHFFVNGIPVPSFVPQQWLIGSVENYAEKNHIDYSCTCATIMYTLEALSAVCDGAAQCDGRTNMWILSLIQLLGTPGGGVAAVGVEGPGGMHGAAAPPEAILRDDAFLNPGDIADEPPPGATAVCSHSFAGSTSVLMADGSSKPIDQVQVGDQVTDSAGGTPPGSPDQKHTVTALHVTHTDRDYTDVTVATPHGPATITGTANHPYWDATTRAWTPADQLHIGDHLQSSHGVQITITAIRDHTATMVTYDLTINTLHTYYVAAGTTPVLVHNCGTVPFITPGSLPAGEESALDDTLANIDAGTVPTDATARRWGIPFQNRGGDLPGGQMDQSPYTEYRVSPPDGTSGAGPLRVVVDSDTGATYYTWTHYGDTGNPPFVRIR